MGNQECRTSTALASPVSSRPGTPLKGRIRVPGDKSISHRSMIFGLLSIGETRVEGLLEGDDVLRTARGLPGARRHHHPRGLRAAGGSSASASAGLTEPSATLDFGNAGTGSRLMMGVAGSHPITSTFDGDASLRKRPMRRILDPLVQMGVTRGERGRGRHGSR